MRPRLFYVCFANGDAIAITHGAAAARAILGGSRAYRSFKEAHAAEEYLSWWNYERAAKDAAIAAALRTRLEAKGHFLAPSTRTSSLSTERSS